MAIQNVLQGQQLQAGQSFIPQAQRSRIAEALIAQGAGSAAPTQGSDFGAVAAQLAGAFTQKTLEDKKKKEDEGFLAQISQALQAPSAPGPEQFLPGGAGLGAVTSQDLGTIRTGTDPLDPQGLNREAVAREEALLRQSRFSNIGRR